MSELKKFCIVLGVFLQVIFLQQAAYAEIFSAISGTVVAEDTGKGVEGVGVNALSMIENKSEQNNTVTDKNGRYVLRDLRPGPYTFVFMKKGSPYLVEEPSLTIELPRGKNVVNANYKLKLGSSVSGVVYGADGITPLSQADITVYVLNPQPKNSRSTKTTKTDALGKYIVRGLPISDECVVEVDLLGHPKLKKTIALAKGKETTNINFKASWDDSTGITGYVKSSIDGKPINNTEVVLRDGAGNDIASTYTDSSGKYSIIGVPTGVYKIVAFWPTGGSLIKKTDISVQQGKLTTVYIEFDKPAPNL